MYSTRKTSVASLLIICLIAMFIFGGCSKVNQENYDKLKVGMKFEDVVKIIGKPDECKTTLGVESCVWEESAKKIKIKFAAKKAVWLSSDGLKK